MPARLLIYPSDPFGLSADELAALVGAAEPRDLGRCFVSAEHPDADPDGSNQYLLAPLGATTYSGSLDAWTIVPHALYPATGEWGAISSGESHVVVGGSERFVAGLAHGLGRDPEAMIADWLEHWAVAQSQDPDGSLGIADWVPAQLAHVVGAERAERALRASRLRY